jgi:hypothetical protein
MIEASKSALCRLVLLLVSINRSKHRSTYPVPQLTRKPFWIPSATDINHAAPMNLSSNPTCRMKVRRQYSLAKGEQVSREYTDRVSKGLT